MVDIQLSRMHKGILLLITGTLLFFYSTGLITRGLNIIVIITSLLMILYGFHLVEGQQYIQRLMRKGKAYQQTKEDNKEE